MIGDYESDNGYSNNDSSSNNNQTPKAKKWQQKEVSITMTLMTVTPVPTKIKSPGLKKQTKVGKYDREVGTQSNT